MHTSGGTSPRPRSAGKTTCTLRRQMPKIKWLITVQRRKAEVAHLADPIALHWHPTHVIPAARNGLEPFISGAFP